jgi:predicted Zn-dependent protease
MSADTIQQHLAEAQRATLAGHPDKARSHFEAVLAIDDEEPTARNWLGADALARTDAPSAATHFEIACKREPGERSHWINLATAHRILGDANRERAALEGALAIDQTDLLALVRLAELHERLGEETPAAERWTAVLALASGIQDPSPEFAAILAHAKHYAGERQRRLADAIETALAGELAEAGARDRRRMQRAADAWLGELEAATATIVAELQAILADPGPS